MTSALHDATLRKFSLRSFWAATTCLIALTSPNIHAFGAPISVTALPITQFKNQEIGSAVDQLVWRGGMVLDGPEDFGGISGLTFVNDTWFVTVTDRGNFISGRIDVGSNGTVKATREVNLTAIQNSKGEDLPPNYSRDAEAVEAILRDGEVAAVRVGFENLTRVADFELESFRPSGAAKEVVIPSSLSNLRTNKSIEAVCIAPDTSPVAGSTLLMTEGEFTNNGDHVGFLLGDRDHGPITLKKVSNFSPTDCAFLPNGDLLVLERGTGFFTFTMQLRRIDANAVAPNAMLTGRVILEASGNDIDNMEGLAIRQTPGGASRIVIISDDNFNNWERTLWLEFGLPGEN